jgi:hypothetical protein
LVAPGAVPFPGPRDEGRGRAPATGRACREDPTGQVLADDGSSRPSAGSALHSLSASASNWSVKAVPDLFPETIDHGALEEVRRVIYTTNSIEALHRSR